MKCPTDEQLACLVEGRLSDRRRREMEAHFSECDQCLEDWASILGVVRGTDSQPSIDVPKALTESAVRLARKKTAGKIPIEKRLSDSAKSAVEWISDQFNHTSFHRMQLKPVRSTREKISDDLIHLRKTFKEIDTEIEIEKNMGRHAIRVRLAGESASPRSIRVILEKENREISSALFESGDVVFEDMPAGHYRLLFNQEGESVGIYQFQIRESANG